ncbi:hypothetical protein [Paenibacillus sp. sgz5001063]|uniref:hypothetical protein n=1 Tax=Paenibacillus sp. sgz5001063 TaxID=3242474 RepID=UPI0036D35BFB
MITTIQHFAARSGMGAGNEKDRPKTVSLPEALVKTLIRIPRHQGQNFSRWSG